MAKKWKKRGQDTERMAPWKEYLNSIRYRYPYILPPAIVKVHPTIVIEGKRITISKGTYTGPSSKVLKRRHARKGGR